MKSGLWILIAVIVVAVIVGAVLRNRMGPIEGPVETARLNEIQEIEDSEAKISALKGFIAEYPESGLKPRAYSAIAKEFLRALKDTARFVDFARDTIEDEEDGESKAIICYRLYKVEIKTSVKAGSLVGEELLDNPIDVGWIYNATAGTIRSNTTVLETDVTGTKYSDY